MSFPLRAGIVGGGAGAFIGAVHRIAAQLDSKAQVVAGAMSSDPQRAQTSADDWHLDRSYASYETMAEAEAARQDGIDFVMITTPNSLHAPVATAFLQAGIHVICDKPLADNLAQAERIAAAVKVSGKLFALTQTYTGYPMVRAAREFVQSGRLGTLRKVQVEYNQDWLKDPLETEGNKQAVWRTDPARAGISCCVADIGTHAQNLLEYVTDSNITAVCAELSSFVAGRELDDDASMLLRLNDGARGTLQCSQIACGEENNLSLRIYGTDAGLEWQQQEPNTLLVKLAGQPWQRWRAGMDYTGTVATAATRTPPGHPEGYLESFANVYVDFIDDVARVAAGGTPLENYPGIAEGLRSMKFVQAAVNSSAAGAVWVDV